MPQRNSTKQSRRTRNQRKRERIRTAFMALCLMILWILLCNVLANAWLYSPAEQPVNGHDYLESIQADPVNYGSSKPATVSQAIYVPEEAEAMEFFPVPLDHDVQAFIIRTCERLNMDTAVIIAMIAQESDFREGCEGDRGDSVGLMQIQAKYHQERMDRLGVTDLKNPLQNVAVGMDYLAELLAEGNGLEWALMAYNGGSQYADDLTEKGMVSDYATEVLANSEKLKDGVEIGNLQI